MSWLICAKGIDARYDPFHSITIWRLRKEETSGKDHENEENEIRNQPDLQRKKKKRKPSQKRDTTVQNKEIWACYKSPSGAFSQKINTERWKLASKGQSQFRKNYK
jgi:hypothetical protein